MEVNIYLGYRKTKKMARLVLCVFLLFLVLVSCKKQEESSIPVIAYFSPEHNQQFTVFDSIRVVADIADEKIIASVRVNLTDENFIAVSPSQTYFPNATSFSLNTYLHISDDKLIGGSYYVLIRADNGTNFKNQYQQIHISALEREYEQTVVITDGGLNSLNVFGTEDFESTSSLFSVNGDFVASEISSVEHLLFIAGKNLTNVNAWNLETNSLSWAIDITPGNPMHNKGCLYFDELLYTSYNYDYIHGYIVGGQLGFSTSIDEFDAPGRIYKHNEFIVVEVQKKNGHNPFIATYFELTGNEKQRRFMAFDVIDFYSADANNVIIIANQDGNGEIYTYDVNNDILTHMTGVQEKVNASVQTGTKDIVLSGNSSTYLYSMEFGHLVTILNKGSQVLAYEEFSESIIAGMNKKIEVYSYPEMVNQKTLLFSDTILDIHIQYSK